jgi:hypothetical protein
MQSQGRVTPRPTINENLKRWASEYLGPPYGIFGPVVANGLTTCSGTPGFATQSQKRAENEFRGGPLRKSRNSAQWSKSLLNLLPTWMLRRKTTAQTSFLSLRSGPRKRDETLARFECVAKPVYPTNWLHFGRQIAKPLAEIELKRQPLRKAPCPICAAVDYLDVLNRK